MLLFLVAALVLLWILLTTHRAELGYHNLSVRGSLVLAYLAFELILLAITEASGLGHHFTAGMVDGSWVVVVLILLYLCRGSITRFTRRLRSQETTRLGLQEHLSAVGAEEWVWLGVVVIIFAILVIIGSLYPPSNTDALVYHLARVEHWIQNRTVAPFATHYLAQIEFSPLGEYNLAQLDLMAGTDRFDAAAQLLAALVSVVGVTELARLLGANRWAQLMSAVICATIPTGILLATSAENDYVAAATGVVLLVALAGLSLERKWLPQLLIVGVAAGLAYMTKSSMLLLFTPAALALLAVAVYRQFRLRPRRSWLFRFVGQFAALVVSAVVVTGPFIIQNIQLFGSAIGPASRALTISPITLDGMGANMVRSTASEFDVGNGLNGPYTYLSKGILPVLSHAYSVFGVPLTDPDDGYSQNSHVFAVRNYALQQRLGDFGANPWHVLLMVMATIVVVVAVIRGHRYLRRALLTAIALGAGYVLFTGLYWWNPFGVRLVLPLLVAWSAIIAIALARFPKWVGRLVLAGLLVACVPQLVDNADAPLIPENIPKEPYLTPYFFDGYPETARPGQALAYESITAMLAESTCRQASIGNWVLVEYPLWVGLAHNHWDGALNDFDVHNVTTRLEPTYRPCAVITQQGRGYATADDDTVNAQFDDLALSVNVSNAATIRTSVPGFNSLVRNVRVYPGGGWGLAAFPGHPLFGGNGTLYVFSETVQSVRLQFHLTAGVSQPTLTVTDHGSQQVPTTLSKGVMTVDLVLSKGANRVGLSTHVSTGNKLAILGLSGVNVTPVHSSYEHS
jgi:hypothetical protein